jgi:hypothetical protein
MRVTKLCLPTLGANGPAARCLTTKRLFVGERERERERERESVVSQLDREALLIRGRICLHWTAILRCAPYTRRK